MHTVVSTNPLPGFQLKVAFDDGTQGIIALEDRLFGPVFEPLRDPAVFAQVFVDAFGAVAWPNGADLAPDALYTQIHDKAKMSADAARLG